jgi:hypothetical protein
MRKLSTVVASVITTLLLISPAYGAAPARALLEESAWTAVFWNSTSLEGQSVLVRLDGNISFNWGYGSPDYRVNADRFSARWTRWVSFAPGEYRFIATSDDGVRVYVDGRLVINQWYVHAPQTFEARVELSAGNHYISVEYFDETGGAQVEFTWQALTAAVDTWRAEYFNQQTPGGVPVVTRNEANIAFNWGNTSPAPGIIFDDNFSAKWTRAFELPAGWYRFTMTVDDGGKLWVNNQLIVDQWRIQSPQTFTANYYHSGGLANVRMEYFDGGGGALAYLTLTQGDVVISNWKGEYFNSTTPGGTPVLVRDDANIDFNWDTGSPAPGIVSSDHFSARWTRSINFEAGRYRFTAQADDGVRLWVNNQLIIDQWRIQAPTTFAAELDLPGGTAQVRLEYYDEAQGALVSLRWDKIATQFVNWRGEYFNNMSLSGTPVLVRDDAAPMFDWDVNSPAPGVVGVDAFSVRWTRTVNFPAGWYRFKLVSDDGSRLYVGNNLAINAWQTQIAQQYSAELYVSGNTPLRLEYYDQGGLASIKFAWEPVEASIRNWRAEYYNSAIPSGAPVLVRDDKNINFNWGDTSPAPGIVNADRFSARWTRSIDLPQGWYRFTMQVDDGGRLWVDQRLLMDAWSVQGYRPYEAEVYLNGGAVNITMEYFENTGFAAAALSWVPIGNAEQSRITLVDDTDAEFQRITGATDWQTEPEGYGNRLTWTRVNAAPQSDTNTGRWLPRLANGRYEVFVYIPDRYTTTSKASYVISSRAGRATRVVNQSANPARWLSLGTYNFYGDNRDYVELSDYTGEAGRLLMAFDAVRWEPR